MISPALITADELPRIQPSDKRVELVRGVMIVREPAGYRHGAVAAKLAAVLLNYSEAGNHGQVLAAETGFQLATNPDTVRAPDVAFISRDRLPEPAPQAFAALAPDLVVEVLSPDDRPGEVLAKVADWLAAGTRLIWVVDPERRIARVYRQDGTETLLSEGDALHGEDVVPGFSCPLSSTIPR
ncbi:MAG TPA: Uma2 family endonuclease [Gemmatimonadales bacterium]|nr:Uma2 family endonuclease [Gemmatimonadales bacterium]